MTTVEIDTVLATPELQELFEQAEGTGSLRYADLVEVLEPLQLDPLETDAVYRELEQRGLEVLEPEAEAREPAPPPPPAQLSRFSAPLSYDFTAVLRVVDRAVPMKFGSLDSVKTVPGDDRRHYAFEAERDPFVAYADGDLLHLRPAGLGDLGRRRSTYRAAADAAAPCGSTVLNCLSRMI